MRNLFNDPDRPPLLDRLSKLTPESQRRWGTMSPQQVLCHLSDPFRIALGDTPAAPFATMLKLWPLNALVVWVLPWPQGAPTTPQILPGTGMTPPAEFERDRQALVEVIQRFAQTDKPLALHPTFGRISRRAWGRVMWRHLDHHLRQFGL